MRKRLSAVLLTALMLTTSVGVYADAPVAAGITANVSQGEKIKSVTIYAMKSTVGGSCIVAIANGVTERPDYFKFEYIKDGKVVQSHTSKSSAFAAHALNSGNYSARVSTYKDGVQTSSFQTHEVYAKYDRPAPPPRVTNWRAYHVKSENGRAIQVDLETSGEFDNFKVEYYFKGEMIGNFTTEDLSFTLEGLKRGWHTIKIVPVLDGEDQYPLYAYSYARLRR